MKILADYGIHLEPGATRTLCPQCSPSRTKKYDKYLAVDAEKGVWFCHHCGWSGGLPRDYLITSDYPLTDGQHAVVTAFRTALRDLPARPGAPWDGGEEETPWPAMPGVAAAKA